MDRVDQVANVIELVIRCHPQGLRVLTGETLPPTSMEIEEIVISLHGPSGEEVGRVDSSPSGHGPQEDVILKMNQIEEILCYAGGWPQIVAAAQGYRDAFPLSWSVFVDHVVWIDSVRGHSRLRESQMARIAQKHGVSEDTVLRRRQDTPRAIARAAMLAPVASWELRAD